MTVRVTQKVRTRIKAPPIEPVPSFRSSSPNGTPTSSSSTASPVSSSARPPRSSTTLFSVIRSAWGINDRVSFERLATDVLSGQFTSNGNVDTRIFEKPAGSVTLLKTDNRGITASMNRIAFEAQWFADDPDGLNDLINGDLDFHSPSEAAGKAAATVRVADY